MSRSVLTTMPDGVTISDQAPPPGGATPSASPASTTALNVRQLARQVRTSRLLTPALRRYWLAVLPHLEPTDRLRLDAILRGVTPPG